MTLSVRVLTTRLGCCLFLMSGTPGSAAAQSADLEKETAQSGPGQPSDEDVDTARSHFKAGVDYYKDGDLSAALVEFKRSYAAVSNYRILYNIGQVCRELRDYTEAERYFQQYLKQGGSEIDDERKIEVENELMRLKSRISAVILSADPPDAEFFVDDVSVGKGPLLDAVRVSAGTRRVAATAPGRTRVTKVIDAVGGETASVNLELPLIVAPQDRPQAPVQAKSGGGVSPALLLGIGTGVLAVGTGVMAYLTHTKESDYHDELRKVTTEAKVDSLRSDLKQFAAITDVLLIATVVTGGATVLTMLLSGESKPQAHPEKADAGMRLALSPGALQLSGQF